MTLLPAPDADALRRLAAERVARRATSRQTAPEASTRPVALPPPVTAVATARGRKATAKRGARTPPIPPVAPGPTVRVVGIDPGASTGLVCVEVLVGARGPDMERARWVGHAVVHPSASKRLTEPERKAALAERIVAQLREWAPGVVVLEEPVDATAAWASGGRRVGAGRSGFTSFGLGSHYGLAVMAARIAAPDARLHAYPVNNHRGRPGWMQGGASRPQSRERTMERLRPMAWAMGCADEPGEDVLMSFGVLTYHLTFHAEIPNAA
ncbi:MAG: RuvC family protein [Georgenia sp.]